MHIFLDDYRIPSDVKWAILPQRFDWVIVRDYDGFVRLLDNMPIAPSFIAFDHDLADAHYKGDFSNPDEKTGYDCAKYLVERCLKKGWEIPDYIVHSLNPIGRENIERFLENAKEHARS